VPLLKRQYNNMIRLLSAHIHVNRVKNVWKNDVQSSLDNSNIYNGNKNKFDSKTLQGGAIKIRDYRATDTRL